MESAIAISHYGRGQLHVVHAWDLWCPDVLESRLPPEEYDVLVATTQTTVATFFDTFLAPFRLSASSENVHLTEGDPGRIVADLVLEKNIDLLVMGTVAQAGIPGVVMGSTAERVLHRLECSVLALKPDGFVSPVSLDDQRVPDDTAIGAAL